MKTNRVKAFDLREELFIEPIIKAEKPKAIEKEIMIQGAYFSEGFYWIDVGDFKKTMIKFREGVKVKLCIQQKIGPSVNILTMSHDAFKNASELSMKNHKIGYINYKGDLVFNTSKPDGTPRKLMDVSRINQLGWKHNISLEKGIKTVYEEVKDTF